MLKFLETCLKESSMAVFCHTTRQRYPQMQKVQRHVLGFSSWFSQHTDKRHSLMNTITELHALCRHETEMFKRKWLILHSLGLVPRDWCIQHHILNRSHLARSMRQEPSVVPPWGWLVGKGDSEPVTCRCHSGSAPPKIRSGPDQICYPNLADSIRSINSVIRFPLLTSQSKLWCIHADLT